MSQLGSKNGEGATSSEPGDDKSSRYDKSIISNNLQFYENMHEKYFQQAKRTKKKSKTRNDQKIVNTLITEEEERTRNGDMAQNTVSEPSIVVQKPSIKPMITGRTTSKTGLYHQRIPMSSIDDLNTVNVGTISSYSLSSKSKAALSINLKNSLYKQCNREEVQEGDELSMYFQSQFDAKSRQLKKSKSRSRDRGRGRMTTIDNTTQKQNPVNVENGGQAQVTSRENKFKTKNTFDEELKSRATDILLPTDYLNSRSSSEASGNTSSYISQLISKTSQFTDLKNLKNIGQNTQIQRYGKLRQV